MAPGQPGLKGATDEDTMAVQSTLAEMEARHAPPPIPPPAPSARRAPPPPPAPPFGALVAEAQRKTPGPQPLPDGKKAARKKIKAADPLEEAASALSATLGKGGVHKGGTAADPPGSDPFRSGSGLSREKG